MHPYILWQVASRSWPRNDEDEALIGLAKLRLAEIKPFS
jgi:hypothetical protein